MKKKHILSLHLCLLICCLSSLGLQAQQLHQLNPEEREPTFYYWDTTWWDHYLLNYSFLSNNECKELDFRSLFQNAPCKCERARPCYTDSTLRIIGVAAPVCYTIPPNCQDTSIANMVPEYFNLYTVGDSGEMVLQASAQWNNQTPRYDMCVASYCSYYGSVDSSAVTREYYPVYEAYFDNPVEVEGLFYVSGTANNNYREGKWTTQEMHWGDTIIINKIRTTWYPHPSVNYILTIYNGSSQGNSIIAPHFYYLMRRYTFIDEWNEIPMVPGIIADTIWQPLYFNIPEFSNMFPIFDTSTSTTVLAPDSCPTPTELRMEPLGHNCYLFSWDGNGANKWEFSITNDSLPNADSMSLRNIAFATVDELDSNQWYTVRVRAVCDSNNISDWSEPLRFYVGNTTPDLPVAMPSLVEQYTSVMPNPAQDRVTISSSFQVNTIEIYSLEGKLMRRQSPHSISTMVTVTDLPAGIYMLRIVTSGGTIFKKLVIK